MQRRSNQFLVIGIILALVGGVSAYVIGAGVIEELPPITPGNNTNQSSTTELNWNVDNLTISIDTTTNNTNST